MRKPGMCENVDQEPSELDRGVSRRCWKQPGRYQPVASRCLCWGAMWFSVSAGKHWLYVSMCHRAGTVTAACDAAHRVPGDLQCGGCMRAWLQPGWLCHTPRWIGSVASSWLQNPSWESLWEMMVAKYPCQVYFWQLNSVQDQLFLATGCPLALLPSPGSPAQCSQWCSMPVEGQEVVWGRWILQ